MIDKLQGRQNGHRRKSSSVRPLTLKENGPVRLCLEVAAKHHRKGYKATELIFLGTHIR